MTIWTRHKKADISPLLKSEKLKSFSKEALQVLMLRGFNTIEKAEAFLFSNFSHLHDTRIMKDAEKAVKILKESIEAGLEIVNYTDYDCDGITSGVVATLSLRVAGGKVNVWSNNRFTHGYGISRHGVDDMLKKFPNTKVIITTDNGIAAMDGVAYAKSLGLIVIVTDHHDPAEETPKADAVVNPKQLDCPYPFKELCGAGVAFKLMLLLFEEMNLPLQSVYDLVDVVALGTIADIVPLVDENRILVEQGLIRMNEEKREVFKWFKELTGVEKVDAHNTVAFKYSPIMNAIGRLKGDPTEAIELFFEEDTEKIIKTIQMLIEVNEERKLLCTEQTELAEVILTQKGMKTVNSIYHPEFHEGIVGIIAGKLKEEYNRPFFVFTNNGNTLKGSGRGIDGIHLKQTMDEMKEDLIGYGGHAKACGVSIKPELLDNFDEKMNEMADKILTEKDFEKKIKVDLPLQIEELTEELLEGLEKLEPFGEGFKRPNLGISEIPVNTTYIMGKEKNHLKIVCGPVNLIMWSGVQHYLEIGRPQKVKAIGYPSLNEWNNKITVQFMIDNEQMKPV